MSEDRKMLEPMATVVSVVLRVVVGLLTVGVVLQVARGGWADGNVCIVDDSAGSSVAPPGFPAEKGAAVESVPRYCGGETDTSLHLLDQLTTLPTVLLLISSLFLLNRLFQGAARDGIHTGLTASRLRVLGWWLLLGGLIAEIIESNAKAAVLASLATSEELTAGSWLAMFTPPYLIVLTGLGLLTFARITSAGAALREDLEGVV
ncbi:hypothetical protein [Streptomyces justiciae]|uniref:hypothetical protein n=1 Tax=Streptomyces justiciae TaxID=2780140 RepID=UPI002117C926|nr:hypothetical protein [Streptomyces justiciae]MCW8381644.1 hypothetical protein [Streptomyces justiciae]